MYPLKRIVIPPFTKYCDMLFGGKNRELIFAKLEENLQNI